jgi:hypothetical protein
MPPQLSGLTAAELAFFSPVPQPNPEESDEDEGKDDRKVRSGKPWKWVLARSFRKRATMARCWVSFERDWGKGQRNANLAR